jgi:hypothetical protein
MNTANKTPDEILAKAKEKIAEKRGHKSWKDLENLGPTWEYDEAALLAITSVREEYEEELRKYKISMGKMTNLWVSATEEVESLRAGNSNTHTIVESGFTKREIFAMHALQGILAKESWVERIIGEGGEKTFAESVAYASVKMADELLKQLRETA